MPLFTIQQRYKYHFSCCIFLPVHVRFFFLVRIYPSALFSVCAFFLVRFFPSALFSHALIYICAFFRCAFILCAIFQCAFFRSPKSDYPGVNNCSGHHTITMFFSWQLKCLAHCVANNSQANLFARTHHRGVAGESCVTKSGHSRVGPIMYGRMGINVVEPSNIPLKKKSTKHKYIWKNRCSFITRI